MDVPEHLRRYRSDIFSDKYLRLSFEDLSRTITAHIAKDGYWYIHPREDRTLSIRRRPEFRRSRIGSGLPATRRAGISR